MIFVSLLSPLCLKASEKLNFATATDTEHFTWTLNLIAGIQRFHFDRLGQVAVYDLGLTSQERLKLNSLAHVQVHDVEQVNPVILKKFIVNNKGKAARGWYSWKPVVIKQAMDLLSNFFYLDSGISVLGPLDLLFKIVDEKGYFFIDCGHSIERMTTQPVIKQFHLNEKNNQWVLNEKGISAGFQGLSRAVYDSYVLPTYILARDITNFEDDGSCPKGFGWARHDQAVFSIQARLLQLKVNDVSHKGILKLKTDGKEMKVHLDQFIAITRADFDLHQALPYLKYKACASKD
jgi:hypothetical protein